MGCEDDPGTPWGQGGSLMACLGQRHGFPMLGCSCTWAVGRESCPRVSLHEEGAPGKTMMTPTSRGCCGAERDSFQSQQHEPARGGRP